MRFISTKNNQIKEGAAMLRYAKGAALSDSIGAWQSAFLLGYLRETSVDETVHPDAGLCLTIDAYAGVAHKAPTNSVSRYQNMKAACATIAEQWPNVKPPPKAIFAP